MNELSVRVVKKAVAALLLAGMAWAATAADAFPSRPITLVVPYPTGGASDVMARAVAPHLSKQLGVPVIIDNVGGAGGALGVQKVLSAPSDGHTILLGTPSESAIVALTNPAVKYAPEDVRLVGMLGISHLFLVARKGLPAQDIDGLVERSRSGSEAGYTYGSVGIGSIFHLAGEALREQTQARLVHVPYKGVGPMVQDLLGGQIDLAFLPSAGTTLGLLDGQKVQLIGPATATRDPRFSSVPTLSEGRSLRSFHWSIWSGVFVSRKTPEAVVATLHAAVIQALRAPEFRSHVEGTGSRAADPMPIEELARSYASEVARYRALAKSVRLDTQ